MALGPFKGNFDLTVISHVEPLDFDRYADPSYYYGYDSKAYRDLLAAYNAHHRREGRGSSCSATSSASSPTDASTPTCSSCRSSRSPTSG